MKILKILFITLSIVTNGVFAQVSSVKERYNKTEQYIAMRDGVKLFCTIYTPKDASKTKKYPIMLHRTCYSVAPYEPNNYPDKLGPSDTMMNEGYIFVYQNVRGRYKSEGVWVNLTPVIDNKKKKTDVDEGSDTYDTLDWLVKNLPFNNGNVGQWGISYPGFFTSAGILSNHPALKASSPQAPISDFWFDDFHHNGTFLQSYLFTFPVFGIQKKDTTSTAWFADGVIKPKTKDGYQFGLDLGSLSNVDKYYKDNFFWQEVINHPNYDDFWQKRDLLRHFRPDLKTAVMTVGGWFDAEDLYGPLNTYKAIEKKNPNAYNTIIMGPFGHGSWRVEAGRTLHNNIYFGDGIVTFYQKEIEAKFFHHFLKGKGDKNTGLPEAYMFDTGLKKWNKFDKWPPANLSKKQMYLGADGKLTFNVPGLPAFVDYISDPLKPVPHTEDITTTISFTPYNYMSEDQRFAGRRPDVLTFVTDELKQDITFGGEITAKLKIASTGTDADFFVKLIDVYPENEPNHPYMPNKNITLSNYWQMVRSEVMSARFRNSFEKPSSLIPNQKTALNFRLQDVLHTFKAGHKIMIQVQSTAFPLFARNPQKFVDNPYKAKIEDYVKATQTIFNDSVIEVDVLP